MINHRQIARGLGYRPPRQPRVPKNTALARKIARWYEQERGREFPGGVENAYIDRTNAGRHQREAGAWSWELRALDLSHGHPQPCGSQWPAKEAAANPELLAWD